MLAEMLTLEDKKRIQDMCEKVLHISQRPGAIFLMPVPYPPPYPTNYALREPKEAPSASIVTCDYWPLEWSKDHPDGQVDILTGGKARPYLILRSFSLHAPRFQGHHVIGLPIRSLKASMRNNQNFMDGLRQNKLPHFYHLPKIRALQYGLDEESVIYAATPVVMLQEYCTRLIGYLNGDELRAVLEKVHRMINTRVILMESEQEEERS